MYRLSTTGNYLFGINPDLTEFIADTPTNDNDGVFMWDGQLEVGVFRPPTSQPLGKLVV